LTPIKVATRGAKIATLLKRGLFEAGQAAPHRLVERRTGDKCSRV
jgi:hypothetical protein